MNDDDDQADRSPRWHKILGWSMTALLLVPLVVAAFTLDEETIQTTIDKLQGPWRSYALGMLVLAAVLMSLGMPGTLVSVSCGVVFGFLQGSLLAWGVVVAAACITYLGGRMLAGKGDLQQKGMLGRIRRAFNRSDWMFVALLRLTPVLPYALINFSLGRWQVTWPSYFVGTVLGVIPGTLAHVYLGSIGRRLVGSGDLHPIEWVLLALGLAVTPVLGYLVMRKVRREQSDPDADSESDEEEKSKQTLSPSDNRQTQMPTTAAPSNR